VEPQVETFLADLKTQETHSRSTQMAYATDLRHFLNYLHSTLSQPPSLKDLNSKNIIGFLSAERQIGRGRNTLLRRRATLRVFTRYLHQRGLIENNPLSNDGGRTDEVISSVAPQRRERCLTPEQIERLKQTLDNNQRPHARRDQAMFAILLETGLLVSNLVNLDLSDLDLGTGRLRLRCDQGSDIWVQLGKAVEPLQRYLREGRPELDQGRFSQALFISQMGKRMSRQSLWQIFRQWGQAAELPLALSPRLIRHTAALHLRRSGRSIQEIQVLLGHSNRLSTKALLRRLEASCSSPDSPMTG
jgi:site-specific recombinase XerD